MAKIELKNPIDLHIKQDTGMTPLLTFDEKGSFEEQKINMLKTLKQLLNMPEEKGGWRTSFLRIAIVGYF